MPAVKFFVRLDLDPICLFVDGHCYASNHSQGKTASRMTVDIVLIGDL